MAKNKGLGRSYDSIFFDNTPAEEKTESSRLTLPISQIDTNPDQPRKTFEAEALASLADSIAANGLLQPILVRKVTDAFSESERYEIIAGERRFRASKLAGLSEIPVIVTEADDLASAKFALVENIQREDLNPYEEAAAYSALMKEYSLTQEQLSAEIGKSRSAIANSLRLLELPDEVAKLVVSGMLSAGHARALLGLKNRAEIHPLAEKCISKNLSVREAEALVKAANREFLRRESLRRDDKIEASDDLKIDYLAELEQRFMRSTGRVMKISDRGAKKVLKLEYRDNEDLEELIKKLAGDSFFENY